MMTNMVRMMTRMATWMNDDMGNDAAKVEVWMVHVGNLKSRFSHVVK